MQPHEFIEGSERVIAHCGLWPSFHDAEVLKLVLDRTDRARSEELFPVLDLYMHGWVMTSEISEDGFYKLKGEGKFHFRFEGITEVEIEGFNSQNVISAMNLELVSHPQDEKRKLLRIELEHCYKFAATFTAEKAKILSIEPYVQ